MDKSAGILQFSLFGERIKSYSAVFPLMGKKGSNWGKFISRVLTHFTFRGKVFGAKFVTTLGARSPTLNLPLGAGPREKSWGIKSPLPFKRKSPPAEDPWELSGNNHTTGEKPTRGSEPTLSKAA